MEREREREREREPGIYELPDISSLKSRVSLIALLGLPNIPSFNEHMLIIPIPYDHLNPAQRLQQQPLFASALDLFNAQSDSKAMLAGDDSAEHLHCPT